MKRPKKILSLIYAAFFLALAYVMPFLTGQLPEIGSMLCPMHLPILLCGFLCGWKIGGSVGLIAPLLRCLVLGMPPFFPKALCMAFELGTYGAVTGFLHRRLPKKRSSVYLALISAMILGRLVWGGAMFVSLGLSGGVFTPEAFLSGALLNALPGIAVQLVLVPVFVFVLNRFALKNGKN